MEIRDAIIINAPVEQVWEVFSGHRLLPGVEPVHHQLPGQLGQSEKVLVKMDMGSFILPITPVLTVVQPPNELSWVVEQGSSFLYNVERHFRLDPLNWEPDPFRAVGDRGRVSVAADLSVPVRPGGQGIPGIQPGSEGEGRRKAA